MRPDPGIALTGSSRSLFAVEALKPLANSLQVFPARWVACSQIKDRDKHVDPMAEDWRTGVRFPPSPPNSFSKTRILRVFLLSLSFQRSTVVFQLPPGSEKHKMAAMTQERLGQRIYQFHRAVDRLQEACKQPENEFIRDSVIQRFEFSFELAWKMLRLKLLEEGIDASTPRSNIRESVSAGILDEGNLWSEMLQKRNETSHTYDDQRARQVYQFVCATALPLLQKLKQKSLSWS